MADAPVQSAKIFSKTLMTLPSISLTFYLKSQHNVIIGFWGAAEQSAPLSGHFK
jgi:hypothetical protein